MKYTNDCIYRKVGKRYHPIGVCEPINYIPNGLWYVRNKEYSRGKTNIEYIGEILKIGDADDISINTQCGIFNMGDTVLESPEMRELLNGSKSYSISDIVNLTIKKVYDISNSKNNNK